MTVVQLIQHINNLVISYETSHVNKFGTQQDDYIMASSMWQLKNKL